MSENLIVKKMSEGDKVVALAGNPNVGKSTVFNGSVIWNGVLERWSGGLELMLRTFFILVGMILSKDT